MTLRDVQPPDLEMQVHTTSEHGRTRLSFILHSPTGAAAFAHRKIAGPVLHTSPEEYQAYLLRKIEKLCERLDVDDSPLLLEEIDRKMTSLGHDLWRELFPPELRSAYREIRRSVRTWMIVSDEPCIPWELVKPYDSSRPDDVIDDDFLALKFELTRWLAGENTPARHIQIRRLAVFRTAPDLPQSEQELELLKKVAQPFPGILQATAPQLSTAEDLLPLLETTDAGLLHFIGHGTPGDTHPDEAGLPFQDGSFLRPLDLDGPIATQIGRNRPLVFLNACWGGRQGWSLTRLGGWTARWVDVCGAGAFIAPMWPARNQMTLAFAQIFYQALAAGAPLGRAAWEARSHLHRQRPGDPSILAYTVYGHPNTQVRFGADPPGAESLPESVPPEPLQWEEQDLRRPSRRRPSVRALITACAAVLIVYGATLPVPNLLFPVDPPSPRLNLPEPPPKAAASTRGHQASLSTTSEACSAAKGLRIEISGGSKLRRALKNALCSFAAPLGEAGISGWTISLALDAPQLTPHTLDGSTQVTCRLEARARAQKTASSLDLGDVSANSSQFDPSVSCEEATKPLAEAVLTRFATELRKEGEL